MGGSSSSAENGKDEIEGGQSAQAYWRGEADH